MFVTELGTRPSTFRLHSPTTRRTLPPGRAKMRKAEHKEFMVEVMELLERLNCPAYLWNDVVFIASAYLLELITLKKRYCYCHPSTTLLC